MIRIGFELEAFCINPVMGTPVLVPTTLPKDECGWLAEIRSDPHTDVRKAIALLRVERECVEEAAAKAGVKLLYEPLLEIPRDLKVKAARTHGKGLVSYRNVYGHETHRNSTKLQTASLHVSFTNEQAFHHGTGQVFKYPGFVDHAKYIAHLDKAFADEIRAARRNPGFYEVKGDGRIEYRSLPNNVDLDKLSIVLSGMLN